GSRPFANNVEPIGVKDSDRMNPPPTHKFPNLLSAAAERMYVSPPFTPLAPPLKFRYVVGFMRSLYCTSAERAIGPHPVVVSTLPVRRMGSNLKRDTFVRNL